MSYREENGQVILTMSRDDYDSLLQVFAIATILPEGTVNFAVVNLLNRLNTGNPHYTPYQVEQK